LCRKKDPRGEAIRWLTQAEDEYNDARLLMSSGRFYLSLYLCQQSAEKALKAFLYLKVEEPIFTHSIAVLLKMAGEIDPDFKPLKETKRLDDYYIPTRYPNGLPGEIPSRYFDDMDEVKQAISWSTEILKKVKSKILHRDA
jgi:HEPN domain-containing protein